MNKVKKILTTLVAATLTVSTGLTSMPMFAHNVKAESKAETISSDTNDMSQYKKINGISSQTVSVSCSEITVRNGTLPELLRKVADGQPSGHHRSRR